MNILMKKMWTYVIDAYILLSLLSEVTTHSAVAQQTSSILVFHQSFNDSSGSSSSSSNNNNIFLRLILTVLFIFALCLKTPSEVSLHDTSCSPSFTYTHSASLGTSPATVTPTCTAVLHVSVTTCPTNPTVGIDKIPAPSKVLKGFDDGAAIVVPVVVVTIIVTLILIYNRQKFKKMLGLLVKKPSHDTSTEHSFHNATFRNTEAVSTDSGYEGIQLGNEDQIMTEGNSSEYLTIDLVSDKVNTSSCMYVGVGTNILPVSNNSYAHLKNDSKFSETDHDYTRSNSHSIRHQTKETQIEEYACAECDNTSKSSKMQCKTKSLNEQDAMYSHTDRHDTRIKNKNNYSHIQQVSTSNTYSKGSRPQTPKETDKGNERLDQEKDYYIDSVTESEYKELSHEYFNLEPPGEVEENKKSTDIGERKIEPDVFKKLTDKNGDKESESSHDYFILEPQICK